MVLLQSGLYKLRKIWAANMVTKSDLSCFELNKNEMWGIYLPVVELLASQEGLYSLESV
jgi:hypothetical protein